MKAGMVHPRTIIFQLFVPLWAGLLWAVLFLNACFWRTCQGMSLNLGFVLPCSIQVWATSPGVSLTNCGFTRILRHQFSPILKVELTYPNVWTYRRFQWQVRMFLLKLWRYSNKHCHSIYLNIAISGKSFFRALPDNCNIFHMLTVGSLRIELRSIG